MGGEQVEEFVVQLGERVFLLEQPVNGLLIYLEDLLYR